MDVRIGRYARPAVSFPENNTCRSDSKWIVVITRVRRRCRAGIAKPFQATYRELERRLAAEPGIAGVTYQRGPVIAWLESAAAS